MVKVCVEDFPMGSIKRQKSPGYYMDEYLKENLDILAEKIADDQMFVIIITGSGHVRVGKSVLMQQVGYYLNYKVNQLHKCNNTFDLTNVIFKGEELQERAFQVPKYSALALDEGDDLVEHYWSQIAKEIRRFFRKAGQLNHFVILVLPDFFELPRTFAITRSMFLINVKFKGKFDRGYFDFYNFERKKDLYLKGKKNADYKAVFPNFYGRFTNMYTIDEKAYRKKKQEDLTKANEEEDKKTPIMIERKVDSWWMKKFYQHGISPQTIAKERGVSLATVYNQLELTKADKRF